MSRVPCLTSLRFTSQQFPDRLPDDMRSYCLAHDLWEPDAVRNSLFRKLWTGETPDICTAMRSGDPCDSGFHAVFAMDGDVPVGLALLQRMHQVIPAERFREHRTRGWIVSSSEPWSLRVLGHTSFYVRPSHRNMGVATRMLWHLEEARLSEIAPDDICEEDLPVLIGTGRAETMMEKHARWHRVLGQAKDCQRRRQTIETLVRETIWIRRDDPAPMIRRLEPWQPLVFGAGKPAPALTIRDLHMQAASA